MSAFLAPIARALGDALRPLRAGFADEAEAEAFFARYGWDVVVPDAATLGSIWQGFGLIDKIEQLVALLDEFVNGTGRDLVSVTLDLLHAAKDLAKAIRSLGAGNVSGAAPFADQGFWSDLAAQIPDDLIATYLETRQPLIHAALHVGTIIRYERTDPPSTSSAPRLRYTRTSIQWGDLIRALTEPGALLADYYKWDKSDPFEHQKLFRAIERSMLAFGLHPAIQPPRPSLVPHIDPNKIESEPLYELEAPIIDAERTSENLWWKIGLVMLPIAQGGGLASGLLVQPVLRGAAGLDMAMSRDMRLSIAAAANASSVFTAKIFPSGATVAIDPNAATVDFKVQITGAPEKPYLLFGARDSHRLELDGFVAAIGTRGAANDPLNPPEAFARIGTGDGSKLRLVVDFGGGSADGFVKKLLAAQEKLEVELGGGLIWSSGQGLSFEGSAAIDFVKQIHLTLGPVSIETLHVRAAGAAGGGGKVHLDFGLGLKGAFGPVTVVIEDIGVRMKLHPSNDGGGAFGGLDVDFGFKPPNGVGVAIDAAAFKGGGYLYFDFDKEEYAGALEFELAGYIRLTAVGLLTTRLPDGTKGFSLLIILTAEFGTGIQIGMGFSLIGVGGLLGLNRTMVLQELVDGVRSGAVNSIMFPTDVVANAPRIISDLKAMFPPKNDVFLIGPMAKIAWGAPALVTLSLGVIIEIPGNIAIVGVLKLSLPTADDPVLVIQANFVGAIEFDKQRFYFYAALFESRILSMTLEGEFGVLVQYGERPDFVLSVGGFHPRYTAPALPFPVPARVSINILNQSNARIRVMSYFAVTSNTAQIGARADLYFSFSKCEIEGFIGFDALFQFSPFHFIIEAGASLAARVFHQGLFSVNVQVALEGPAPWRVNGSGTVSLRFFDVDFDFSRTWGEVKQSPVTVADVLGILRKELEADHAWSAILPPTANLLVTLRKNEDEANTLILHPVGALRVSQKQIPLALGIRHVGASTASVERATLAVASAGLVRRGDALEKFPMGQFVPMDDATKLSRPGFEDGVGGLELVSAGADLVTGDAVVRTVRYEESVVDTLYRRRRQSWLTLSAAQHDLYALSGSAANSAFSIRNRTPFDAGPKVAVSAQNWAVAFQATNQAVSPDAVSFPSETMAIDYLAQQSAMGAVTQSAMHVIAAYELAQ